MQKVENVLVHKFLSQQRLSCPAQFQRVFKLGKKIVTPHLTLIFCKNEVNFPRIGYAISKKLVARAVDRNQIKRIIRESFRQQQVLVAPVDVVAISRRGISQCSKRDIRTGLDTAWKILQTYFE